MNIVVSRSSHWRNLDIILSKWQLYSHDFLTSTPLKEYYYTNLAAVATSLCWILKSRKDGLIANSLEYKLVFYEN